MLSPFQQDDFFAELLACDGGWPCSEQVNAYYPVVQRLGQVGKQ